MPIREFKCEDCKNVEERLFLNNEPEIAPNCLCGKIMEKISFSKSNWKWADGQWRGDSSKIK